MPSALAIVDAEASGHYLALNDVGTLSDFRPTLEALCVIQALSGL